LSITVITGIRDIAESSFETVELTVAEELGSLVLQQMRFGGARGVDDIALRAAIATQITRIGCVASSGTSIQRESRVNNQRLVGIQPWKAQTVP